MATLTVMQSFDECVYLPKHLLKEIGWQMGETIDIDTQAQSLILSATHNKPIISEKDKQLLKKSAGMFKFNKDTAPKTSLFDFDVADHITLFDEED